MIFATIFVKIDREREREREKDYYGKEMKRWENWKKKENAYWEINEIKRSNLGVKKIREQFSTFAFFKK